MDDTIRSLLQIVARGFYSGHQILVFDAVMLHVVISEDDLAFLLDHTKKEVRAFASGLVEDRLIACHNVREDGPNARLQQRLYYYIRSTEAIDAVKWKVHAIVTSIKNEMTSYGNPHGYTCPRCARKVTQIDAISLLSDDKLSFICDRCGATLVEDDLLLQALVEQEKLERFMVQLNPVISLLKKIDTLVVEDLLYEQAKERRIPVRLELEAQYNVTRVPKKQMLALLQLAAHKANATLHVSISAPDENSEREQREREERRIKLEQNALPEWHQALTVDAVEAPKKEEEAETVEMTEAERKEKEAQDALAAYYAELGDDDDDFDLEDL